jgi:hypothetical protein
MKLSRKVITLILCCFFICEIKKLVTNSKKLLNSYIFDKVDVQITKLLHLSFLFSGQLGRGRVVWGWLYLIDSLQKKKTATQLYCQIPSNFVFQLYSFDSGYSLVVFGKDIWSGGRGKSISSYIFFQK